MYESSSILAIEDRKNRLIYIAITDYFVYKISTLGGYIEFVRPNHIYPISKQTNMKVSIKFATAVILTAGALIASGSVAQAGEGGAAGSVSVIMNDGQVGQLSAAAAVGKLNAAAATFTTPFTTTASAYGSGGVITLTGATGDLNNATITDASYTGATDESLSVAQANNLTGYTTIDAKAGTVIIPAVAAPTADGTKIPR
jgi:hypothetical protein